MKIGIEYLAGFFDGEGCIDVQRMYPRVSGRKRFYCRPRVRLALSKPGLFLLDMLQAEYGGSISYRNPTALNQQVSASWEFLDKVGIQKFLCELLPHLHIKREQAKFALWWFDNMSGRQSKQGYDRVEEARKLFADELKLMKLDPQRLSEEAASRVWALMR